MKLHSLTAFATTCGVLIAPDQSHAAYLGLGTQLQTQVSINGAGGGLKSVYRVYAVLSDPSDYVISVGGMTGSPVNIKSLNAAGSFPGSNFFNPGSGGDTAPPNSDNSGAPNYWWDTFATIGLYWEDPRDPDDDQTTLSPDFPQFIFAKEFGPNTSATWSLPGAIDQGQAGGPNGKPGLITDGTGLTGTGIMIMQLTVNAGGHVTGTVNITGLTNGETFTATAQSFASFIPAPPALLLLFAPALFSKRRRT